jgi:hypothetical protein
MNQLLITFVALCLFSSCKKEHCCFDEELFEKHKNDYCPMDCPGVTGCDGKTYCNECVAATKGIRVN